MTKELYFAIDKLAKSVWRESRLMALAAPDSVIVKELRLQAKYRAEVVAHGCIYQLLCKRVYDYVYHHAHEEKTAHLNAEEYLYCAAADLKRRHNIDVIHILNNVFSKEKIF